jgi:drug/metabolite transporter (DMT)-like permease
MNGPLIMFSSAVLFSLMATMVRMLGNSVPAAEIIFIRSFISVALILLMIASGKVSFKVGSKEKLIFRGIVGGISLMLYFYGLTMTTLSNAVLLAYTYPIFAAIFSVMYLKETLTKEKVFFMFIAFLGMLVVFGFDMNSLNLGDILALLSGVTSGMAIVAIRQLRKTDSSAMITFSFVLSGLIFSLFFLKGNMIVPTSDQMTLLVLMGVLGTFGQLLMTYGYKLVSTATGGIISMSSIVMTALLGIIVLGQKPTLHMALGSVLIFGAAAFFSREEDCETAK